MSCPLLCQGAGSGAPQHYHINPAWNVLVYGRKGWVLSPPALTVFSNVPSAAKAPQLAAALARGSTGGSTDGSTSRANGSDTPVEPSHPAAADPAGVVNPWRFVPSALPYGVSAISPSEAAPGADGQVAPLTLPPLDMNELLYCTTPPLQIKKKERRSPRQKGPCFSLTPSPRRFDASKKRGT